MHIFETRVLVNVDLYKGLVNEPGKLILTAALNTVHELQCQR